MEDFKYDGCPICLMNLENMEYRRLPCHYTHIFCTVCLNKLLKDRLKCDGFACPLCKFQMSFPDRGIDSFKKMDVKKSIKGNLILNVEAELDRLKKQEKYDMSRLDRFFDNVLLIVRNERKLLKGEYTEIVEKRRSQLGNILNDLSSLPNNDEKKLKETIEHLDEISQQNVTIDLDTSRCEGWRILYSEYEKPDSSYQKKVDHLQHFFGAKNFFYALTQKGIIEFNKDSHNTSYIDINFNCFELSTDKEMFGLSKLPRNDYSVFKFHGISKVFMKLLTKKTWKISNPYHTLCYILGFDLILFDTITNEIIFKKDFFSSNIYSYREKKDGMFYLLRSDLDLSFCKIVDMLKISCFRGEKVAVTIIDKKISLRNDIIKEMVNGKLFLRNKDYVFLLNSENQTAKAYPHKNIFKDGSIWHYVQTESQISFSILKNFESFSEISVKCYNL
ncbi:unnamed protein product [Dimorphilus gyrociliatus]|uniref:RING-type domain-containing protein n=1 Tax=Dimorphilus gyrociliatus TaxID=2664684 RepID=A0A7I8VG27_9ANNE|nr:unnamed protein product [Dimorphilus gyrociliatus]